jgi:hypothetical protein
VRGDATTRDKKEVQYSYVLWDDSSRITSPNHPSGFAANGPHCRAFHLRFRSYCTCFLIPRSAAATLLAPLAVVSFSVLS